MKVNLIWFFNFGIWISQYLYLNLVSNAACDVCEKTFKNLAHLRRHQRYAHRGKFDLVF
jgi:uncharacterized Zn-finger protein